MLFWLLILFPAIKFTRNLANYSRCNYFLKEHSKYLQEENWDFAEHIHDILKLFCEAGVSDGRVGYVEPVGFGMIRHGDASIHENILSRRGDIASLVRRMLYQAKGTFRSQMIDSVNPLYWVNAVIYLPRNILGYLSIPSESVITKVVQILYWVIVWPLTFFYTLYKEEIDNLVRLWLAQILS